MIAYRINNNLLYVYNGIVSDLLLSLRMMLLWLNKKRSCSSLQLTL